MLWKALFRSSHLVKQKELVRAITSTLELINRASSATLGPMGRLVAIESELHEPRITKDGVTVVKHIEFVWLHLCRPEGWKTQWPRW